MNKVKRILTIVLAMAMMMAMGIVSSAANETATITVSGLASTGKNTVECYKILTSDVKADSGYKFSDGFEKIGDYTTAKDFLAASVEEQKSALSNEKFNDNNTVSGTLTGTTWSATVEAGYYAIFITNAADDGQETIIYTNPMIVSVEYKNAELKTDGSYEYDVLENDSDNSVVAKYTTIPVTKKATSDDSKDEVVAIGSTQEYTIETYIPSQVEKFVLTDVLTGATYTRKDTSVTIEGVEGNLADKTVSYDDETGNMIITLDNYLENNAGKKVTITYTVTVTATKVENEVTPNDGKHKFTPAEEKLYTGAITLTKYGEKDDELEGAVFNVYASVDMEEGTEESTEESDPLKFTYNEEDGMYHLDPNGSKSSPNVSTNEDGELTIIGLDLGTYWFKEVQAPEGYSINTTDVNATIEYSNTTAQVELNPASTTMNDTKLSALPSTGGIGTTIFTIVGCLIMIAAAVMFFVGRRRARK